MEKTNGDNHIRVKQMNWFLRRRNTKQFATTWTELSPNCLPTRTTPFEINLKSPVVIVVVIIMMTKIGRYLPP